LRDDLLEDPFNLREGALTVPEAPGLGIRLNPEVLARYAA